MKKKIENFTIKLPCKLKTILEKINLNQYGIIFIVAENLKLLGSISDGDIRRALIKKPDLKKIISYKNNETDFSKIEIALNEYRETNNSTSTCFKTNISSIIIFYKGTHNLWFYLITSLIKVKSQKPSKEWKYC